MVSIRYINVNYFEAIPILALLLNAILSRKSFLPISQQKFYGI
jgi:hypothetical protein